jgi:peptidyl serine alpha-galactosyltransferase
MEMTESRRVATNNNSNITKSLSQDKEERDIQLVFTTSCSVFQDWQSIALFVSAHDVNQTGYLTRIASGCTPEQEVQLREFHRKTIEVLNPKFLLYFTPDYSRENPRYNYIFFNKAFGMKHWLTNRFGYHFDDMSKNEDNPYNDDLIIILDPDQVMLRPIPRDFKDENVLFLDTSKASVPALNYTRVSRGRPMAQMYLLGNTWLHKMNWTHAFGDTRAARQSPAFHTSKEEYLYFHGSGPPFLTAAYDMVRIVDTWTKVAPPMLDLNLTFMSEMFSYLTAAAHNKLPHRMVTSLMLSRVGAKHEGWPLILKLNSVDNVSPRQLPFVLHYCQKYYLGPYSFYKHALPKGSYNIMSCNHPLFAEPPAHIIKYRQTVTTRGMVYNHTRQERMSYGFFLYHLLRKVNRALEHYKNIHCENGNNEKTYTQNFLR